MADGIQLRADLKGAYLNLGDPVDLVLAPTLADGVGASQIGVRRRGVDRLMPVAPRKLGRVLIERAPEVNHLTLLHQACRIGNNFWCNLIQGT